MTRKEKYLTKEELEETKKLSIMEGASTSITTGFGNNYVIPYAIKLGASSSEVAILSSFPLFFGSISQLIGAKLTELKKDRKTIITLFVALQALSLLPLFFLPLFTKSIIILTLIFSIYLAFANLAAPGWNSWIGDIIPESDRANYFSRRNKQTTLALMFSVLGAGLILNHFDKTNVWIGFGILFSIALISRAFSAYLFIKHHEPQFILESSAHVSIKEFITHMTKNNFGNFVIFRSIITFAVIIASPFFAVYMLTTLKFTYLQFSAVILAPMIVKYATLRYWANYSNKYGNKPLIFIAGILVSIIPLMWFTAGMFFKDSNLIFVFIILIEIVAGFAWGGFDLSTFNYMLESTSNGNRARLHAYFTLFFGTAVLLGGFAGAFLVQTPIFSNPQGLLWIFFISFILRIIPVLIFLPKMKEVRLHYKVKEGRLFFEMVINRPLGFAINTTMTSIAILESRINRLKKPLNKLVNKSKDVFQSKPEKTQKQPVKKKSK